MRGWLTRPHYSRADGLALFALFEGAALLGSSDLRPSWGVLATIGMVAFIYILKGVLVSLFAKGAPSSQRIFSSQDDPLMKVWISQGGVAYAACPECPWERDQGERTTRELIEAAIAHKREEHPPAQ